MFHRSISHLLTAQHLQDSNWLPALPDSLTIQRLTDTMTQQFNNTHFRSCISTLMQFQRNSSFLFTEYVHPRKLKQFLPLEVHTKKEEGPMVPQYIVFILLNSSRLLLQQELNYTSDAAENLKHS